MPEPRFRARTFRRVFVRVPGGSTVLHYRKRKPGKAQCAGCGKMLFGVPHARQRELRAMPKSSKRPERPFGGVLCPACSRREFVKRARVVKL